MNKTKIPWVKNPDGTQGYSWNPITGCLNHINGLCKGGNFPCFAYKLAYGRLKPRYLAHHDYIQQLAVNDIRMTGHPDQDPFYPRFWESKLYHAWGGKPKGIFVCDMSDLFGLGIPQKWTETVLNLIRLHDRNRYYLLTKQPQNLVQFSPFPDNCFVGVTVCNRDMARQAYKYLQDVEAKVKYISFEPLLDDVTYDTAFLLTANCQWFIIGSQTKPTVHPRFEWVESIINVCDRIGVKVFIKPPLSDVMNYHREEMPAGEIER